MRFWDYLRYRRRMLLAAAVCCVIFAASFALYRLPLRAVLYPVGLCLLVGLGFAVWDYRRTLKRHRALTGCGDLTAELLRELPPPESLAEEDYRAQLLHLRQLCTELQSAADNRYRDAIEYYTTWAHQIKTPIASMRLALQGEDTALFRRLLSDLSRTEQYVEMVMAFLRLEDAPGDYVFREVALDEVLRQALRRFSAEFIDRRLRLDYTPTELTVLTDEKWLCFVLEQLLSNALKYTREGSITVELAGERVLAIRDTGIGIAPEEGVYRAERPGGQAGQRAGAVPVQPYLPQPGGRADGEKHLRRGDHPAAGFYAVPPAGGMRGTSPGEGRAARRVGRRRRP